MPADPLELRMKAWEKTIEVQEHFNDIALRIRSLFVTLLAAIITIFGYAVKSAQAGSVSTDLTRILVPYLPVVAILGVFICLAFWFLDRMWYHRLLRGAVKMGERLESRLEADLGDIGLTKQISSESRVFIGAYQLDATLRLDFFYGLCLLVIVVASEYIESARASTYWITAAAAVAAFLGAMLRSKGRRDADHSSKRTGSA